MYIPFAPGAPQNDRNKHKAKQLAFEVANLRH